MEYIYDINQTKNQRVNIDQLFDEILSSSITVAVQEIVVRDNNIIIKMKTSLSEAEKNILDLIISKHEVTETLINDFLVTYDRRLITKVSSRPLFTNGYFTSVGDAEDDPNNYGGGNQVGYVIFDANNYETEKEIVFTFNVENNRTWVYEGFLYWENCAGDLFSFEIRTKATPYELASNTNFKRSLQTGMIMPANGDGDVIIDLDNIYPVSLVPRTDTGKLPLYGFWDVTYNSATKKYENLTPVPDGTGRYNLFFAEVTLKKYINKFCMLGSNSMYFRTADPSELGSNLKCVSKFYAALPPHDWKAAVNISMFREKLPR